MNTTYAAFDRHGKHLHGCDSAADMDGWLSKREYGRYPVYVLDRWSEVSLGIYRIDRGQQYPYMDAPAMTISSELVGQPNPMKLTRTMTHCADIVKFVDDLLRKDT